MEVRNSLLARSAMVAVDPQLCLHDVMKKADVSKLAETEDKDGIEGLWLNVKTAMDSAIDNMNLLDGCKNAEPSLLGMISCFANLEDEETENAKVFLTCDFEHESQSVEVKNWRLCDPDENMHLLKTDGEHASLRQTLFTFFGRSVSKFESVKLTCDKDGATSSSITDQHLFEAQNFIVSSTHLNAGDRLEVSVANLKGYRKVVIQMNGRETILYWPWKKSIADEMKEFHLEVFIQPASHGNRRCPEAKNAPNAAPQTSTALTNENSAARILGTAMDDDNCIGKGLRWLVSCCCPLGFNTIYLRHQRKISRSAGRYRRPTKYGKMMHKKLCGRKSGSASSSKSRRKHRARAAEKAKRGRR